MKLSELIAEARFRTGDRSKQYLCTDADFTRFAVQAENEACRRARLLVDSTTAQFCTLSFTAGEVSKTINSRVIFVRRAQWDGRTILGRVSYKDIDRARPGWDSEEGDPSVWIPDWQTGKFRPYPTPQEAGDVTLTVVRLPAEDMASMESEPEIHPRFHMSLVDWMEHRFYATQDGDMLDPKKSAEALARFELEFGVASRAIDEAWIETQHGFTEDEGTF